MCVTYCLLIIDNCFSVTQPQKGRLLKTLPKQEIEWKISFELELFEVTVGWTSVIHFVDSGTDDDPHRRGTRIPAIFVNKNEILFALNTDIPNTYHRRKIPLNQKIRYVIEQVLEHPSQDPIIHIGLMNRWSMIGPIAGKRLSLM